ncbi:MAG: SH3 domain-containing protein [Caldilineaceae bacterium]|nr:SH3 domain-containing protein [Caldilineaceae bacterium]
MKLGQGNASLRFGVAALLGLMLILSSAVYFGRAQAAPGSAPVEQVGRIAVVGASGATLLDAPGGNELQALPVGATLTAEGRSEDSVWLFVTLRNGEQGWVAVEDVVVFGLDELPVLEAGALPNAPAPTEEATEAAGEEATALPTNTPRPTNTPTPTPSPTPSPTPTNTPTPEPTATPTPEPTATPARSQASMVTGGSLAVVSSRGAQLLDAPNGNVAAELEVGNSVTVDARTEDSAWLHGVTAAGAAGWLSAEDVIAFKVDELPVATDDAPAADAIMPEATTPAEADAETEAEQAMTEDATPAAQEEADMAEATAEATPTATERPGTIPPAASPTPRPTPALAAGDVGGTVALTGSRLNIRSGPGTAYGILAKAYPNEQFKVIGRNGPATWVEIELPDAENPSGWVSARFISLTDPVSSLPITSDDVSEPQPTAAPQPDEEEPAATPAAPASATTAAEPSGMSGALAFQTKVSGDIYLYDLETGALRFLTKGYEPDISRDGSKVAFTRYGGEHGVWSINSDGSNEQPIFGGRELIASPKWSPDGEWIVFSRNDGSYQCYDLGFGICILESQICPPFFPQCLPSSAQVERPNFSLARVDADGNEYRDLNVLNSARAPDWNEAGIVYDSGPNIEITEDTPDGETRLVVADVGLDDADWAPHGGLIAYQVQGGSHWEIYVISPDGESAPRALTRPATALVDQMPSNVAPAWSPDGRYIAYLSNRTDEEEAGPWRIWVMNADGSNQHPLPINVPIEYGFGHEQMLSWGG